MSDFKHATEASSPPVSHEPPLEPEQLLPEIGSDKDLERLKKDISALVEKQTWKGSEDLKKNMDAIRDYFKDRMNWFNREKRHQIEFKYWESTDKNYRVFRFIAGKGPRKTTLIAHLDTVPPGDVKSWGADPFTLRTETRLYRGAPSEFWVGRGAIDDKGPAVVAFDVLLRTLDAVDSRSDALDDVTLEVLFDTSEETVMSTPKYFEWLKDLQNPPLPPDQLPDLGIVFDAFWCVRAEKGVERPEFWVSPDEFPVATAETQATSLAIVDLKSDPGAGNMIPGSATAVIAGDAADLTTLADSVLTWYRAYPFDDEAYHPAALVVSKPTGGRVELTALVAGAQHGSAPGENRANGANPIVSLTNFLAGLIDRGVLVNNAQGELCRFIRWAFGTRVFGENHPELLVRHDSIFERGNGTSYGLTRLQSGGENKPVHLVVDIRYALGHHGQGWDGSEGLIGGRKSPSVFSRTLALLVDKYQKTAGGKKIEFSTITYFAPDVRWPANERLLRVNQAYRSVMGANCPMLAIGGGTDSKGWEFLVTAGALFSDNLGPPINYHGLNEGAPVRDLLDSRAILLKLFAQAVGSAATDAAKSAPVGFAACLH